MACTDPCCGCPCPGVIIPPPSKPFAVCCMVCPPPILAPTRPEPVKPLQLPCPYPIETPLSDEEAQRTRYANFYNNYNIDWHAESPSHRTPSGPDPRPNKCAGVAVDGKGVCCEDYQKRKQQNNCDEGCPTGFKPCTMKLMPPPGCHPCGVWCAEVQPCPPKPKKKNTYIPGPCTRPCCKHWKPKDGPCKYDKPCKAHCFNHEVGKVGTVNC